MFERHASAHHASAAKLPILDEGFLGRLAGHVGPVVLADLAADGLLELADRVTRLGELLEAGDLDAIARIGHDLVGMAGHMGLARLSAVAAELNRAARSGDRDATLAQVAETRRLGADASAALRAYLDALIAG